MRAKRKRRSCDEDGIQDLVSILKQSVDAREHMNARNDSNEIGQ